MQELTSMNPLSVPRTAYCSLRIYHYNLLRDKSTKEVLRISPSLPFDQTKERRGFHRDCWEESEPCKRLKSILQSIDIARYVRQIVTFGLGSIEHDSDQLPRSTFQHALLLTVYDLLGKTQEGTGGIACYVQDPAYTSNDELILRELGITVLNDPEAFLKVDDSTLVISCAPDVPVKQVLSEFTKPVAILWDRVREQDRPGMWYSSVSCCINRFQWHPNILKGQAGLFSRQRDDI